METGVQGPNTSSICCLTPLLPSAHQGNQSSPKERDKQRPQGERAPAAASQAPQAPGRSSFPGSVFRWGFSVPSHPRLSQAISREPGARFKGWPSPRTPRLMAAWAAYPCSGEPSAPWLRDVAHAMSVLNALRPSLGFKVKLKSIERDKSPN